LSPKQFRFAIFPLSFPYVTKSAIFVRWYLSLIGGLIVLAYGIQRAEPVIILGQLPGTLVYTRNLMLIHRSKRIALEQEMV
jgi:lipid-A-disaccharide synthase-like uncharacterized protein